MKIGVCIKSTPDTDARIRVNDAEDGIVQTDLKFVISPYDSFGLEEAVQTKEEHGGEVVLLSVGRDAVVKNLRDGLAVGADRAVLLSDAALEQTDALGVGRALAAAIKREDLQLVFCGCQAIDDDNSQVPAMVAELLSWPQVSFVSEFSTDGSSFQATRDVGGGVREVVSGTLPVVITATRGLNTPRYPKLPAIMKAKRKPLATLSLSDLGLAPADVAPAVVLSNYAPPPKRPEGRVLEGERSEVVSQLVRLLREEAKVI
jgi:electron transfer flavoprotein beta subunit